MIHCNLESVDKSMRHEGRAALYSQSIPAVDPIFDLPGLRLRDGYWNSLLLSMVISQKLLAKTALLEI